MRESAYYVEKNYFNKKIQKFSRECDNFGRNIV